MKIRTSLVLLLLSGNLLLSGTETERDSARIEQPVAPAGTYSIADQILESSNYVFLPYDDWGVKGVFQLFGLPATALQLTSGGLPLNDPVYGQVPLSWLNPRFDKITLGSTAVTITPRYFRTDKVFSRFDYYRGDYGYLNFSMVLCGTLPDSTTVWRFVGENLGYDGYYGMIGPDRRKTGESVSQIFRLDFSSRLKYWQIDLNSAYRKYLPGYTQAVPSSITTYLLPSSEGNVKEYQASIGVSATQATERDSTTLGLQQANYVYGQFADDPDFGFKGVADQTDLKIYREQRFGRWRIHLALEPMTRAVTLRNGFYLRQNLFSWLMGFTRPLKKTSLGFNLGAHNRNFTGDMYYFYDLTRRDKIGVRFTNNYALYPLVYKLNFKANQKLSTDGFTYRLRTLDLQHNGRNIQLDLAINQVNSDFFMPYKSTIDDTMITYSRQKLDAIYLSTNGKLNLPWRMSLTARSLLSNNSDGLWVQGWGQIRQELDLFKKNLRLYVAGEITYWDTAARLAWFEELRGTGNVGVDYYTNNRLNLVGRVGGNIGDFHLFYVIYNVEGRAFSTISGMTSRNRIKIFGVEWQFLD
ncbi:MAG: hypothetical protein V1681_02040 [Candidatus Neomarinimicrobiota bacterium]